MIRQQNKNKYICVIFYIVIEALAIIGAYVTNHYTKTRMGMLRHVVYLNGKWEKSLPIPIIKWIAISIIIALVILAYLRYHKGKASFKVNMMVMLLTIAVSGWTVYFLLAYNTERNRAYYIISVCFILATVLQNIIYHCSHSIKLKN